MELNDFIDRMNETHGTAVPNFELTKKIESQDRKEE